MRIISLQTLVPAAILAIVFTTAGRAEETSPVTVSQQELQAKIAYCKTCHGLSGQGFRGAFPMPRLAGQQPEYLENQLRAFNERRRTNPIMFNVAHVLNPPMITALAAHFKDLDAEPLGGAPNSWPRERHSMRRECLTPTFLHALPVTVQRVKVTGHFPGWPVSSMTIFFASW